MHRSGSSTIEGSLSMEAARSDFSLRLSFLLSSPSEGSSSVLMLLNLGLEPLSSLCSASRARGAFTEFVWTPSQGVGAWLPASSCR